MTDPAQSPKPGQCRVVYCSGRKGAPKTRTAAYAEADAATGENPDSTVRFLERYRMGQWWFFCWS